MSTLYLNDILYRNNLDPNRVKLLRHSTRSNKRCIKCFKGGFLEEYQRLQKENFFKECDYFLSFVSEKGTRARFYGCYSVGEGVHVNKVTMPVGFPAPEFFSEDYYSFDIKPSHHLSDLKDRLIIEWGQGTLAWHQWAGKNEKVVLGLLYDPE